MKLIKPSFEIIPQESGLEGIYKQIELAGRTCYKSEDKITENSAKEFVDRMIKSGHGAMLEHGTVYLYANWYLHAAGSPISRYYDNKFSKFIGNDNGTFVTTNLRVLVENNWMDDLQYLCEPTEHHEKRVTVKFVCDRGVSHEFVRHRVFSFAQESTRYCNYSKGKFNNELVFIIPDWLNLEEGNYEERFLISKEDGEKIKAIGCNDSYWNISSSTEGRFLEACIWAEYYYMDLVSTWNWKAQEARAILPNALKTELVMTGFISDWKHFFELRDAGSAHPQARELAHTLHEEFVIRKWI